jgi:membrane-bound serine protease (ClpP class)
MILARASRRKKLRADRHFLINSTGVVEHPLNPTGTVLIHGELWRAQSRHGGIIPPKTRVTVVSLRDHLLLVDE